jgi:hypothetical protein
MNARKKGRPGRGRQRENGTVQTTLAIADQVVKYKSPRRSPGQSASAHAEGGGP